jgi:hypothetical protein
MPRKLNRDVPDAAAAGVDEHRLAFLEPHAVDERLPRRDQHERHGSGFDHRELRGLRAA